MARTDSAAAIDRRIAADFTLSRQELLETLQRAHPELTDADIDSFLCHKYIEAVTIDGEQRFHRKSPRNLNLLNPAYNGGARRRGDKASPARISYVDSVLSFYRGTNPRGLSHEVTYRFTIDVPGQEVFAGDTLRVWMPVPMATDRQRDIDILSTTPSAYVLSDGRSIHNSIYFEAPHTLRATRRTSSTPAASSPRANTPPRPTFSPTSSHTTPHLPNTGNIRPSRHRTSSASTRSRMQS